MLCYICNLSTVFRTRDGSRISAVSQRHQSSFQNSQATLQISGAIIDDSGLYKCEVVVDNLRVNSEARLTVNRKMPNGQVGEKVPIKEPEVDTGGGAKKKRIKKRTGSDLEEISKKKGQETEQKG